MTDTINASPSLKRVSNERCRDKAALLENNLFNLITKQNDPIRCRFQINRDKYPDAAIVKALLQLFQRIKIPVAGLFPLLRKLLTRAIPENKQLRVKKPLSDFSETTDPDMRRICPSMEIRLSRNRLVMEIKGTPPIPSRNGAIGKAFLPPESSPGLLDQNGAIDFKETNKYPIVQTGDNLFFITPAFQGRPGIAYDGSILEVGEALPFDIELKGGVDHVESLDSEGNSIGYFLRAAKTGVAVLIRTDGKITSLEITDKLKIKRLDYSTGNIGSTVICPISIKLDTICNGFNVRTKGTVDVKILDGGGVETESHATIHTIMPGSKVVARKNINLKFSRKAELISKNGTISIKEELVDSTLFSHDILFETSKGIMTGTTLDASTLSLKKLYLYGRNTIYLGRRLFAQKKDISASLVKLERKAIALEEEKRKMLDTLVQTPKVTMDLQRRRAELVKVMAQIDKNISAISLTFEGTLRRAASLRIYAGSKKERPGQPEIFIESKNDNDDFIKITAAYDKQKGIIFTCT